MRCASIVDDFGLTGRFGRLGHRSRRAGAQMVSDGRRAVVGELEVRHRNGRMFDEQERKACKVG